MAVNSRACVDPDGLTTASYFTTFRDTAVIKKGKSETLHASIEVWLAFNILSHYLYIFQQWRSSFNVVHVQSLLKAAWLLAGARGRRPVIWWGYSRVARTVPGGGYRNFG